MGGYVKTFKVKDGFKNKNNTLMTFCINYEELLQKYQAIWTKIEDLKNIKLNALPVHDHRYIKTKIRTYSNKVYANFILPEVNIEFKSFTVISIDSLLICQLQVYLALIKL